MSAKIIDGKVIADGIKEALKKDIEELKSKGNGPHLVAVQVGENPASRIYVNNQKKSCEAIGIDYTLDELPEDTNEQQLIDHIKKLNDDKSVSGMILQMPLPEGADARKVQAMIAPEKDVEGMNAANMGQVVYGNPRIGPCTPLGAVELIKSTGVKIEGAEVTVVGHSEIVGKPIALLLLDKFATTTVCHIATQDLTAHTKNADILVVATGKSQAVWQRYRKARKAHEKDPQNNPKPDVPNLSPLVTADMIKPGAVVIDVAINRLPKELDADGKPVLNDKGKPAMKTVGDVDFDAAKEVASWITPVPGGAGPMTVAMLLRNTVEAAKIAAG